MQYVWPAHGTWRVFDMGGGDLHDTRTGRSIVGREPIRVPGPDAAGILSGSLSWRTALRVAWSYVLVALLLVCSWTLEDLGLWQVQTALEVGALGAIGLLAWRAIVLFAEEERERRELEEGESARAASEARFQAMYVSMVEDVTKRKVAEEALRESEERYRITFDQAAVGIAHVDPTGLWLRINQGLCDMLGYTREELLGGGFQGVTHPGDLEQNMVLFRQLMAGELGSYAVTKRYIRKDGSVIWAVARTTLVRDASGNPEYTISVIEDITERKLTEEALRHQALHDTLTDLPNRTLLQDRLDQALRSANREHGPLSLLLTDLDRFKEINDTFGHHVGDLLLQEVAMRLRRVVRESDTAARLGGDEFAVVLPETDEKGAILAACRILTALTRPFLVEDKSFDIRTSFGIARYPEDGTDSTTLLRAADVAMYAAKRRGDEYAVYAPHQDENSAGRLTMISELRQAIEQEQLILHYQPKMELKTGEVRSVEALVRWQHPQRGPIPPLEFIPLAEHTGLIKPLTNWVLNEALRQCRMWQEAGLKVGVAVNLSVWSLHDDDLVRTVMELLQRWQLEPTFLGLELTESVLMVDPNRALEILTEIHDLGVQLSIDDFGTGYSSLGYLKRLPVQQLKIDKSFVQHMATHEDDSFIAHAIVDLSHNMRLEVVAEGVEDKQTLRLLSMMGCDLAQGYYLSRPLPAEELFRWIQRVDRSIAT